MGIDARLQELSILNAAPKALSWAASASLSLSRGTNACNKNLVILVGKPPYMLGQSLSWRVISAAAAAAAKTAVAMCWIHAARHDTQSCVSEPARQQAAALQACAICPCGDLRVL